MIIQQSIRPLFMEPLEDRTLLASYASGFTVDSNNTVLTGVGAAHVVGVGGAWGTKATITLPNFPAHTMLVVWPDPSIASSGYPRSSGTGDVDTYVLKVGDRIETFDYEFNSPSNGSSYYPANGSSYSQNVNAWFQHTGPLTIEIYGENLEAGDEGWQIGNVVVTWYLPSVSIHSQGILSEDDVAPANPSSADPGFWVERDLPSGWSPVGTPTHDIIPDTSVGLSYSGTASTSDTSILSKKYVVELSGAQSMVYVATAVDDDQIEPRETIIATLNSVPATARYILGAATTAQLEIKDNDFDFKGLELTFSDQGVKHDTGTQDVYDNNANTGGVQHWSDLDGDKQDDTGKGAPLSFRRSIPAGGGNAASPTYVTLNAQVKLEYDDLAAVSGGGVTMDLSGVGTGVGAGQYTGTLTGYNATTKTGTVTITCPTALAETIDDGELSIVWKVIRKLNGVVNKQPAYGTTKNHVYVAGAATAAVFETVLDLGCKGGKGKRPLESWEQDPNTQLPLNGFPAIVEQLVDGIWAQFSVGNAPSNVKRADGQSLTFWGDRNVVNQNLVYDTAKLLKFQHGACGAWADLLVETLRTQGISGARASTIFANPAAIVPLIGQPAPPPNHSTELSALINRGPGQGTAQPQTRLFMDRSWDAGGNPQAPIGIHAVVKIAGINVVYDPSYGKAYTGATMGVAEEAWEDTAIQAWGYTYVAPNGDRLPGANALHNANGPRETTFTP